MNITILADNTAANGLEGEWGFSAYIRNNGRTLLLDTGASGLFAENARALGADLSKVEWGVLSHAHFDHSDGLADFFTENDAAKFYLRSGAGENCYGMEDGELKYIGVHRGFLGGYADRLQYVSGDYELCAGVYLIPHKTPGLAEAGRRAEMFRLEDGGYVPDDFAHEQSLVIRTDSGLVILNSCSHGGADNIVHEIADTFPGERIRAIIGGFHLFKTPEEQVRAFAQRLLDTGVELVVTGHCTGEAACDTLESVLGDRLIRMNTGLVLEI